MRPMRLLGLKTFRHGVHPPESKDETSGLAIRQFPFAPLLIVPLVQHMGTPSILVVEEGQEVPRGQRIARPDGFMSVSMHAPAPASCAASRWRRASAAGWCRRSSSSRFPARPRRSRRARPARSNGDARRDHRRDPGRRRRRPRRRRVPDPRQAEDPRGQVRRHADHQRGRVRALPDHRPPGDAGAARRHLHGHPLPAEGHRRRAGDHRRRGQQARRCRAPARRPSRATCRPRSRCCRSSTRRAPRRC